MAQFNFSEQDLRAAPGGIQSNILAHNGAVQVLALDAIIKTISKIWIMTITAGALCFISAAFMKREKLELEHASGGEAEGRP